MSRKPNPVTAVIDKDVPLPPRKRYPFREMTPGDSVVATGKSARALAQVWTRRTGWQFTFRRIDADSVRVWRIA
jgi:hypothetical protein